MSTMTITIERTPHTLQFAGQSLQVEELSIRLPFARKPADLGELGGRDQHKVYVTETKELIAGYTLIDVSSHVEALEWARRFPAPFPGQACCIEVRPLMGGIDLPPEAAADSLAAQFRPHIQAAQLSHTPIVPHLADSRHSAGLVLSDLEVAPVQPGAIQAGALDGCLDHGFVGCDGRPDVDAFGLAHSILQLRSRRSASYSNFMLIGPGEPSMTKG